MTPSHNSGEVTGVGGSSEIGMFKYEIWEGKKMGEQKKTFQIPKSVRRQKTKKKTSKLVTQAQFKQWTQRASFHSQDVCFTSN